MFPEHLCINRDNIEFIHRILHPILTKSDLLVHFSIADHRALRKKVFTDKLLKQIGISIKEYRYRSIFTADESRRIYENLSITWLRTILKKM